MMMPRRLLLVDDGDPCSQHQQLTLEEADTDQPGLFESEDRLRQFPLADIVAGALADRQQEPLLHVRKGNDLLGGGHGDPELEEDAVQRLGGIVLLSVAWRDLVLLFTNDVFERRTFLACQTTEYEKALAGCRDGHEPLQLLRANRGRMSIKTQCSDYTIMA